jgi:hypothetical protein
VNIDDMVKRARDGDPRAVARMISLVENNSPQLREIMAAIVAHAGEAAVVGNVYQIDEAETTLLDPALRRDYDRPLNLFHKRRRRRPVEPRGRR